MDRHSKMLELIIDRKQTNILNSRAAIAAKKTSESFTAPLTTITSMET